MKQSAEGSMRPPDPPIGVIGATRHVSAGVILAALVLVSFGCRALAAWRVGTPWISADEIIYASLGRSLWEHGQLSILDADTGFYSLLYPAFVGGPLSLADGVAGHRFVQLLQAGVMSATAVPVFLWGRRLAGESWALVAAALTLALPALGYSALIMTEALFLPLMTLALWALARALAQPTAGRQALLAAALLAVVATRLQAVVLVPVVITAVLVKVVLDRHAQVLRRFAPALAGLAVATILAALMGSTVLGGYAAAAEGTYAFGEVARFVAYHAAGIVLLSGIVPALGLALFCWSTFRHGEPSNDIRAFVAVACAYLPWLSLEVGIFASREVGHLAGRDLATAAPITLLGFALWLSRGGLRPQPLTAAVALLATSALIFLPVRPFAEQRSIHDVLELVLLEWVRPDLRETAFACVLAVVILAFTLLRPRRVWLLAPLVFLLLAGGSVAASREAGTQSQARERAFLGGKPTWLDDAGARETAYLFAPEFHWPTVWQHVFWNRSIDQVWTFSSATVHGPMPQTPVVARPDGRLVAAGGVLVDAEFVVAPSSFALVGDRVATIRQEGMNVAGLALWRPRGAVRLSSYTEGVSADGEFSSSATVTVFDCERGRLRATLLGKTAGRVTLKLNRRVQRVVPLRKGALWDGSVEARPQAGGICIFELEADGLVGVRRLSFTRR